MTERSSCKESLVPLKSQPAHRNTLLSGLARTVGLFTHKKNRQEDPNSALPDGYNPLNVSIAGVMYEDRAQKVCRCYLGEKVWLYREPDNRADQNAIKVVNCRGEKLGYIGRVLAARLASYMDNGHNPLPAIITELARDVPGSRVRARIGFYVPTALAETVAHTRPINYYRDIGGAGATYLLLDCEETTFNQIIEKFEEIGYTCARHGLSYRPAADGRQYQWYIRFDETLSDEDVEEFFRLYFNIVPSRDKIAAEWSELVDVVDRENANLRAQNEELRREIGELRDELARSRRNLERRAYEVWREEVLPELFHSIEFLRDSVDMILHELHSRRPVFRLLQEIMIRPEQVRGKSVESAPGWLERHFSTGQKDDGRIYFKRDKCQGKWLVLVTFKGTQEQDIKYLQKLS